MFLSLSMLFQDIVIADDHQVIICEMNIFQN